MTETRWNRIYGAVGEFEDGPDLVRAARIIREQGYSQLDAFTPFPVYGIDEALGIPGSKLGWIVVCGGTFGAAFALRLMWWTGAVIIRW